MSIVVIGIDYDEYGEGDQDTYRGVIVKCEGKVEKIFDSGDVFLDYTSAVTWTRKKDFVTLISSNVDQFVMDGNKYTWGFYDDVETIIPNEN